MSKDLIDLYYENEKLALQNALFIRKSLKSNEKRHEKMSKDLDKLINEGKSGSTTAERILRNIKNLEDMMNAQRKEVPNIDEQYKSLIKLFKERYPEGLKALQEDLTNKLIHKGVLGV